MTIGGSLSSADVGGNYPIRSKNGINRLTATSVSANITAAVNSGTGKIGLFKTTNGAMSGNLLFRELSAPVGGGAADPAEKPVTFWYWISRTQQWRDMMTAA